MIFTFINSIFKTVFFSWYATRIFKHATLNYLVRNIDLFFLIMSNKKMTTANTMIAA